MGGRKRQLGRALAACVREDAVADARVRLGAIVAQGGTAALASLARYHRVVPFLYLALRDVRGADPDVVGALQREYAFHTARHMRALADLSLLKESLDRRHIDWLAMKGPVLAELLYARPDLRTYGDIDVVVRRAMYERAVEALQADGWRLLDRNWELIRRERRGELHFALDHGTVADVHWHLLNRESVRRSLSLSMEEAFERAVEVNLAGSMVRTLHPVDSLAHLCIHATLSGAHRLSWLKDIERAAAAAAVSWGDVIEVCERWRASPLAAIALDRSQRLLGAPVPPEVLDRLFGSGFRRGSTRWLDAVWPPESTHGRLTPSILWAQTTRESWATTLATILRRAARAMGRVTTGAPSPEGDEDAPIMAPTGDERTRQDFFRSLRDPQDAGPGGSI